MKQTTIAIFLSIMFATLTVAPDIVVLIDYDYDVSVLIDANEEEERKGEEKIKDYKIQIPRSAQLDCYYASIEEAKNLSFHLNNYNSIVKELTSPPPELNI